MVRPDDVEMKQCFWTEHGGGVQVTGVPEERRSHQAAAPQPGDGAVPSEDV